MVERLAELAHVVVERYASELIVVAGTMLSALGAVWLASRLTWGGGRKERARQNAEDALEQLWKIQIQLLHCQFGCGEDSILPSSTEGKAQDLHTLQLEIARFGQIVSMKRLHAELLEQCGDVGHRLGSAVGRQFQAVVLGSDEDYLSEIVENGQFGEHKALEAALRDAASQ